MQRKRAKKDQRVLQKAMEAEEAAEAKAKKKCLHPECPSSWRGSEAWQECVACERRTCPKHKGTHEGHPCTAAAHAGSKRKAPRARK